MSKISTVSRIVLPALVIGVGFLVMTGLVASKPAPVRSPDSDSGIPVTTIRVTSQATPLSVSAQGTVIAAREVVLQAEIPGRVVKRSASLVPGGRFKEGELLLQLDPREYSLVAKQSEAQVEQARQQLAVEESRGDLAKEEWEIIGEDSAATESGRSAALREPQKAEAEARMAAAKQSQNLALLNVGRTAILAPFNGFVRDGRVDVGQYVAPGAQLGTLVGSDAFWVKVSVPVDQLRHLQVPGFNAEDGKGAVVRVWQDLGEDKVERSGRLVRLYGDLDPVGRMARVLVEIDDPLGLRLPEAERGLPLLLGAYVHVDIEGGEMLDVVEVPRSALHAGEFVYLVGPESRLVVRKVEIAWRKPQTVLVKKGLAAGDEVVTSRLASAVDGLKLRQVEK